MPSGPADTTASNPPVIVCRECGAVSPRLTLPAGSEENCPRCGHRLALSRQSCISPCLALAVAGLIFGLLANILPLLVFNVYGDEQSNRLFSGVISLFAQGYGAVAVLVFLCSMLAPFLRFGGLAWVLGACFFRQPLPALAPLLKLSHWAGKWNLVEVYAVALVVAMARLDLLGAVELRIGAAFVVALFLCSLMLDQWLNPDEVWEKVEDLQ